MNSDVAWELLRSASRRVDFEEDDGDDDVDQDEIATARQSSASPPQRVPSDHGLPHVALLQAQVRGLTRENESLRRDKAKLTEELTECKAGATALLTQCDRLAEEFVAMQRELEATKAKLSVHESRAVASPQSHLTRRDTNLETGRRSPRSPHFAKVTSPPKPRHENDFQHKAKKAALNSAAASVNPSPAPLPELSGRSPPTRQWLAPLDAVPVPLPVPLEERVVDAERQFALSRRDTPKGFSVMRI